MTGLLRKKFNAGTFSPWINWGLLLGCGVITLHPVTPTWNSNSNYSFGWLIPFVAIFLFAERWPSRPSRTMSAQPRLAPWVAVWGLLFFALRLASETDPDWRPGLWMLVALYVSGILSWFWIYGGRPWMAHFAFPVCFLFLSLPWFFQTEYQLVQGLMRWNAMLASKTLVAISIPATPSGNIIKLQNCSLGVEEACSGILSLQASVMMGCLLGEIYFLTVVRRFALVLISVSLALVGNYFRTFFLAMIAFYNGSDAVLLWHDTAGYSILAFTAVGTWLAALALGPGKAPEVRVQEKKIDEQTRYVLQSLAAQRLAVLLFLLAATAEVATQAWFGWRELSLKHHPGWVAHMPTSNSFEETKLSDVTIEALRCDIFKGGKWQDAQGLEWSVYWMHYDPKPYTRIVLGWHNPDNCLPSVGLIKDQDYPNFWANVNGRDFYIHPKKFLSDNTPVFIFWVVYPNTGDLPAETDTRVRLPFETKFRTHLIDVWKGYRGVSVETLEVALTGTRDYETAKAAFLDGVKAIVVPVASRG